MSRWFVHSLLASSLLLGCGGSTVASSGQDTAGTPDDTGGDDTTPPDDGGTDPWSLPPTCTSGKTYSFGSGLQMEPGVACNGSCHNHRSHTIMGTVYPTGHEPNRCYGVNGTVAGAKVVVVDNAGKTATLSVNAYGNFYSTTSLTAPFTVKVTSPTGERAMTSPAPDGNCNRCHTQDGAEGAPGRIVVP